MKNKDSIEDFIIYPRKYVRLLRNGEITVNEWMLYTWMRVNSNPYGISTVSLLGLKEDIFKGVSTNYINRLLLSLLEKKLIYYKSRHGRRGSFEVHFGDVKLPDGRIKTLENYFVQDRVRNETQSTSSTQSEVSTEFVLSGQKFGVAFGSDKSMQNDTIASSTVRSSYNDNDIDTNKDNDDSIINKPLKGRGIPTKGFIPSSLEESRCLDVAIALGEPTLDFLLSVVKENGVDFIDRAWGIYKEESKDTIKNPRAYFNAIIQRLKRPVLEEINTDDIPF